MQNKITVRIIIDVIMLLALLQGWWFVALPLGLLGAGVFPYYFELIIAGIAYDALFGFMLSEGWVGYIATVTSALCMVIIIILKKVLRS